MLQTINYRWISSSLWRQTLATLASCFLAMGTGLNLGITAVMLPQLEEDNTFPYDKKYESWIASITTLSMVLGCFSSGPCLDYFGRTAAHTILNIPAIAGWLTIAFAANNTQILIGRFLIGISAGASWPITLVYIGELSQPNYRSIFLLLPALMTHAGVILIHVVGKYVYWKTSCFLCLVPSVLCAGFFIFMKESPLWLISKRRIEEGVIAFKYFRGDGEDAAKELQSILDRYKDKAGNQNCRNMIDLICDRSLLQPFLVAFFLTLCTQSSGAYALTFYAESIYTDTFSGQVDGYMLMIATDLIRAVASIAVCVFAKTLPKNKTYMFCCLGVILSLGCLVLFFYFNPGNLIWIQIGLVTLFTIFGGTLVTLGWSFIPEILPNHIRGLGSAIASAMGYIVLFIAVKIIPGILDRFGEPAMYTGFGICTLICSIVLYFTLPETKDRTLQSIEDDYTKNNCNTRL